jgi:hypothetical protein
MNIKYLIDYSKFLKKKRYYDPKIITWQNNNTTLLKSNGVEITNVYILLILETN